MLRRVWSLAMLAVVACGGDKNLPEWQEDNTKYPPQVFYATGDAGGAGGGGARGQVDDGGGYSDPNDPYGTNGNGNGSGGSSFDAAGAPPGLPRPRVCIDLSACCAKPKACDREIFACQAIAMLNDENVCERVLDFYGAVGCENYLNIGAQVLTGFAGCIPKRGGGFY